MIFSLGRLLSTPGALSELERAGIPPALLLARHASGDWGDVDSTDWAANERAIRDGSRLLSVYFAGSVKLYVITEATNDQNEREATTILLSSEY